MSASASVDIVPQDLRRHYLFSGLSDAQFASLWPRLRFKEFAAEQPLFRHGDPARAFYVLHSGAVKLYRLSDDGHEKIMRLIQPGQSFAEAVMFMDVPAYPVHAQALRSGIAVAIESAAYLKIMEASFPACQTVFARMTERIQAHWDEIEALTLQNSQYRVVHYLLGLASAREAGAANVTLPITKSVIAAQLALTPETLSRILRILADAELINMRGYQVHIPNLSALRQHLLR